MWYSLLLLGYKPVQHVTVLNTVDNCNTVLSIVILKSYGTTVIYAVHRWPKRWYVVHDCTCFMVAPLKYVCTCARVRAHTHTQICSLAIHDRDTRSAPGPSWYHVVSWSFSCCSLSSSSSCFFLIASSPNLQTITYLSCIQYKHTPSEILRQYIIPMN